jgi:tetratricopeptide (TPR) repeat protein
MARASGSRPVEIVYYPKKARGPVPRRAQTVETLVTEEIEAHDRRPSRKGRKTLTDEALDPTERAFSDLTRLGHEAFEAGRVDEAKVIFESMVALGRRDPFAHTMLGTILLSAQQLDEALEQFEAALEIDPDELAALVYRGEIRLSRRKTAKAVDDLERAVKLGGAADPFVQRARKLLALARLR